MKFKNLLITLFFPASAFSQFSSPGKECLDSFKKDLFDPESSYAVAMEKDGLLRYRTKDRNGVEVMRYAYCWNTIGGKWTRNKSEEIIKSMDYTTKKLNERTACLKSSNIIVSCDKKHPKIDIDDAEIILGFK